MKKYLMLQKRYFKGQYNAFQEFWQKIYSKNIDKSRKKGYNNNAGRNTLYTRVTELTFKRYVISSAARTPSGVFFIIGANMNIFIYSDESGVLDKKHNDYFVFGGVMFFSKEQKEQWARKYITAEKTIRNCESVDNCKEVKASNITNKSKSKLYRSLNNTEKFGIVIAQKRLGDGLFENKKSKQRYLDWAFKMAVKSKFLELIKKGILDPLQVENLYFYVDEHSTATNGLYELRETMEQEFKHGVWNFDYMVYHPPIFPKLKSLRVEFCNSKVKTLVRAADIIANHIFYIAKQNEGIVEQTNNLHIKYHPN